MGTYLMQIVFYFVSSIMIQLAVPSSVTDASWAKFILRSQRKGKLLFDEF